MSLFVRTGGITSVTVLNKHILILFVIHVVIFGSVYTFYMHIFIYSTYEWCIQLINTGVFYLISIHNTFTMHILLIVFGKMSQHTMFSIYYCNLRFINNVVINKTKLFLPQHMWPQPTLFCFCFGYLIWTLCFT